MLLELVMSVERLTGLKVRMMGAGERTLTTLANDILNELTASHGLTERERDLTYAPVSSLPSQHATVAHGER